MSTRLTNISPPKFAQRLGKSFTSKLISNIYMYIINLHIYTRAYYSIAMATNLNFILSCEYGIILLQKEESFSYFFQLSNFLHFFKISPFLTIFSKISFFSNAHFFLSTIVEDIFKIN